MFKKGDKTKEAVKRSIKHWLLLFTAFAVVGGGACYFAFLGALELHQSNLRNELEALAKLGALQVDPAEHQQLNDPSAMETPLYTRQIERLGRVQEQISTIRYIYTIRRIDGKLFFILDPTPPGDHDNDQIDDKSCLMDPYESEPYPVYEVFKTGRSVATGQLETDQWGTFLSGYAPIKDEHGQTVAVLGIDIEASQVMTQEKQLALVFLAAFIFTLVLGGSVSYYLATHIARSATSTRDQIGGAIARSGNRTTILQIGLAAAVIACIALGLYGRAASRLEKQEYQASGKSMERLFRLQFEIDSLLDTAVPVSETFASIMAGLSTPELATLQLRVKTAQTNYRQGKALWRDEMERVGDDIRSRTADLNSRQTELGSQLVAHHETFNVLFIVAAMLALGSLVLVRAATVQQDQLARTAQEASRLHEEVGIKNAEIEATNIVLTRALEDLQDNFEAMVQAWVKAVEAKDLYTAGHSERVMQYSTAIGRRMGLSEHDLRVLEMGTLIHDIGKIGIPDSILIKPSRLSNEEFEVVKSHPDIGYRMISSIPLFQECAPIVLWHHEKMDGSGYPDGLCGDEIPLLVKISTVADMFDAMTSTRAYRASLSASIALENLRKDAEKGALEPKIVEILAEIVNEQGVLWQPPRQDAA
ncbi:MAG: HD domain-containing protein [Fimbriimonadaceae bacterium]|nr:HD domain-containing protein [Fimbriimonadaceae bacterium]